MYVDEEKQRLRFLEECWRSWSHQSGIPKRMGWDGMGLKEGRKEGGREGRKEGRKEGRNIVSYTYLGSCSQAQGTLHSKKTLEEALTSGEKLLQHMHDVSPYFSPRDESSKPRVGFQLPSLRCVAVIFREPSTRSAQKCTQPTQEPNQPRMRTDGTHHQPTESSPSSL